VALAKTSDIAIVLIGNQPVCSATLSRCPDPTEGKEAFDRKQIDLNAEQQKLVEDVYRVNPRTIVVLVSGFPYTIDWVEGHVPAIVHMAHSSEEEGAALADVLFGDYDPAGRLAMTWPQAIGQLPPMMDYNIRDGRNYMYSKVKPLYPFGYGLSYTRFEYSGMQISSATLHEAGEVTVSIQVTNMGARAGDEVVQMYVQHTNSKVQRPLEELEGFQRVSLGAKATKTVEFHLPAKLLAYWDQTDNEWRIENDRVRIMIGSSSADIKATDAVAVAQ
jgi:beta-glucosidase